LNGQERLLLKPRIDPCDPGYLLEIIVPAFRKVAALKKWKYRGREKATTFGIDMVLTRPARVVRKEEAAQYSSTRTDRTCRRFSSQSCCRSSRSARRTTGHRNPRRSAFLQEAGAIRECEEHGWAKDGAHPHSRESAFDIAHRDPPPDLSPEKAVAEVRDVLDSIGDTCPECSTLAADQ
jgi:hypothetical protein